MTGDCDYLVKGAGASAMAFVDAMLRESDATFTIVDKRAAPGPSTDDTTRRGNRPREEDPAFVTADVIMPPPCTEMFSTNARKC